MPDKVIVVKMIRSIFATAFSSLLFLFAFLQSFAQTENAETCIREMMQQSDVVGISVAVVKKNKIIYTHFFGWKDSASNTPLSDDCLFRIASISKSYPWHDKWTKSYVVDIKSLNRQ